MIRLLDPDQDRRQILIPTAHIVGAPDENFPNSLKLGDLCEPHARVLFDHGSDHEIPFQQKEVTSDMAQCIEDIMTKASFSQLFPRLSDLT